MEDDPHLRLLERWTGALAERFPAGGIGVAGSVAAGRHTADSDLDLLVADRGVARGHQLAVRDEGVRVNVVCVHPDAFAALLRDDAHRFAGIRTSYVAGVRVVRDPDGALAALQDAARQVLRARAESPEPFLAALRERAAAALAGVDEPRAGPRSAAVASFLADAALLRAGRTALDKRDGLRPFDALAGVDPGLHGMLEALLLHGAPPRATLDRAFAHVFGG